MAKPLRVEFPGAIYHVSSRMVGSWQRFTFKSGGRLIRYAGLTQREVVQLLARGTGGAVSAQLALLPELIRTGASLQRRTGIIENRLEDNRAETFNGLDRKCLTHVN